MLTEAEKAWYAKRKEEKIIPSCDTCEMHLVVGNIEEQLKEAEYRLMYSMNNGLEWLFVPYWFNRVSDCSHCISDSKHPCFKINPRLVKEQEDYLKPDFEDAAIFNAIVYRKLAMPPTEYTPPCPEGNSDHCTCDCIFLDCNEARIKWALLEAEKEMGCS